MRSRRRTKTVLGGPESASKPRLRVVTESAYPDVAQTLAAACEDLEHHILEISYRGTDDETPLTRHVEPLRIFSEDSHRYLQAYCRTSEGWRSFRIDRISHAQALDECFSPRSDAPRPSIALDANSRAQLLLSADCPLPAWRNLKVTATNADGSCTVSIPWTGSSWLPKHVVALMGKALVLKPQSLVDACKEYAEKLLQAGSMHDLSDE